jgi:plasmid stabilization system protein ParE
MQTLKRPQFLLDLAGELTWLKNQAGADVAERWYQELLATIEDLERHPHLGRKRPDLKPEGIRSWRIKQFPRWLIFYTAEDENLILLRVRYGMMDIARIEMES